MAKWFCVTEGKQYGPVSEDVFRTWVRTGRVRPTDYVWCEGMPEWKPASEVPGVFAAAPGGQIPPVPPAAAPGTQPAPTLEERDAASAPAAPGFAPDQYVKPHRGAMVLVFGILSMVFCCFVFGIVAWVMGNTDLGEMAAGRMDRSGQGMTRAGKICGIISIVCFVILAVCYTFLFMAVLHGGHRTRF